MKRPQEEMAQVRLREIRKADMPGIMALEQELFPEDAWTPEMFAAEFAQPASRRLYLVAEEGETLIAYAGMMFTGGPQAEVVLEVREDNPRARRLYLRHGFTEIGIRRGYYQPSGVDAVVMRKVLA